MSNPVSLRQEGQILHVSLDRPEKLNAFSAGLVDSLHEALGVAESEKVRLVVLSGSGKGFSGGFDLDGLEDMSDGDLLLRFVRLEDLLQRVYHAPFATLALAHGACYGAAADLVAACQWRIAAPDARFRMPGLRFGVVLGTNRLAGLLGADTARSLLLRASAFDSAEAKAAGFVQAVSTQDDWSKIVENSLEETLALSPSAFASMRLRTTSDTRDADLAALVRSASEGSIKERIQIYLSDVRKAKNG